MANFFWHPACHVQRANACDRTVSEASMNGTKTLTIRHEQYEINNDDRNGGVLMEDATGATNSPVPVTSAIAKNEDSQR